MNGELSTALSLLAVGMITVFVVLMLVVIVGNVLISLVNRFFAEEITAISEEIPKSKIAAISAAINIITEGKGRIKNIDKIE